MVRSGKNGAARPPGTATSSRDRDIYQRYATGLYRQAFLTLGIRPRDIAALLRTALLRLRT